jgi:Flp pilus assembly protein TadG
MAKEHSFMKRNTEKGQAIILLVFGVIGLLGAAALAIDGGQLYSNRRHAQNTTDTAAFSGALVVANSGASAPTFAVSGATLNDARDATGNRVAQNGYDYSSDPMVTFDPDSNSHVNITGPHFDAGAYYLVEVTMTTQLTTAFAHLMFGGPLETTITSTARARPSQSFLYGQAVVGMSVDKCKAIWFQGSAETEITGGGVFSNAAPTGGCPSAEKSGSGDVVINDGDAAAAGDFDVQGSGSISPAPTSSAAQQQFAHLPTPDCSGLANRSDGGSVLEPGIYSRIRITNGTVTLNPGMYCVTGSSGISITGGNVTGTGVFFYLADGDVDIRGNAQVIFTAPTDLTDASGNQWGGMLFYMDYGNDGTLSFNGNGDTSYTGTIFAPSPPGNSGNHKCTLNGNSDDVGYNAQIICDSVMVTGNNDLNITYIEEENFQLPPSVDLFQ